MSNHAGQRQNNADGTAGPRSRLTGDPSAARAEQPDRQDPEPAQAEGQRAVRRLSSRGWGWGEAWGGGRLCLGLPGVGWGERRGGEGRWVGRLTARRVAGMARWHLPPPSLSHPCPAPVTASAPLRGERRGGWRDNESTTRQGTRTSSPPHVQLPSVGHIPRGCCCTPAPRCTHGLPAGPGLMWIAVQCMGR